MFSDGWYTAQTERSEIKQDPETCCCEMAIMIERNENTHTLCLEQDGCNLRGKALKQTARLHKQSGKTNTHPASNVWRIHHFCCCTKSGHIKDARREKSKAACPLLIVKANVGRPLEWEASAVVSEWLLIDSWIDYSGCCGTLLLSWCLEDEGVSGFHPVWAATGKGGGRGRRHGQTGRWRVSYFSVISVGEEGRLQDVSVGSHSSRSSLSKVRSQRSRSVCNWTQSCFEINSICAPERFYKTPEKCTQMIFLRPSVANMLFDIVGASLLHISALLFSCHPPVW